MVCSNRINSWVFTSKFCSVLLILALFSASVVYAEEKKVNSLSFLDKLQFWKKTPDHSEDKILRKKKGQIQMKKGKAKKKFDEAWLWKKAPKLPDGPMTLEESVAIALRYNRTIKSAYLNRITQKYSLAVSNDEFYPDLTITPSFTLGSTGPTSATDFRQDTYTYGTSFAATQKIKTGGTFTFTWAQSLADVEANVRPDLTSSWTLGFTQPLLRGAGVDIATVSLRTARIGDENNILSLQSTLISTITSIITTYRSYLQTYQKRGIAAESLERTKKQYEINKALVETGRLAGAELIQSEADIASKEFDFITSRNSLQSSLLSLIQSLDINKQTNIIPVEVDKSKIKMIKPDYDKSMQIALANRTDYLQALNNYEVSKMDYMVGKNNRLWALSFNASSSLSRADTRFFENQRHLGSLGRQDYSVGLSLDIPFGDRSRHSSYVSSAVALENTRIALRELKQTIEIDIKDRIRDIDLRILQLGLARRAKELSRRKLEAERVRLKAGLTTNFQIVTFQNDLVSAQNNETDAYINYLNALTNFDQALGTTLKTWGIELVDKPESWDSVLQKLEENKWFNLDE